MYVNVHVVRCVYGLVTVSLSLYLQVNSWRHDIHRNGPPYKRGMSVFLQLKQCSKNIMGNTTGISLLINLSNVYIQACTVD